MQDNPLDGEASAAAAHRPTPVSLASGPGAQAAPYRHTVLVTGAGSGLGRAMAQHLALAGDRVFATVRSPVRARAATVEATKEGVPMQFLPLELTDSADIDAVVATLQASGGLDVLVLNAGFGVFGAIEDVDDAMAAKQFAVNVLGPLALTRRLLPMLRARRGHVIWIGSLAGRLALPFQGHYSATKAAVAAVSDAMRIELAPFGVRVTCIEPGDFSTGFTNARVVATPPTSPYRVAAGKCLRAAEDQERAGPSPAQVARVVAAIAGSRHPPARRPVGRWARTICWLAGWLPDALRERLVAANYGIG